ncbi:type II toxin-antitoxin system VapC family toxin [Geminocystis sp. CENA526]|uniref:type II toxin-antitoxin system VapC family toxin n=1 Tax=Geminocystis sp. CENA526 TaxID=1355871 RepID=UPI003D6FEF92
MIVLDTNIISELMKGDGCHNNVYLRVSRQPLNNLYTTTISQAEIFLGIAILSEGKRKEKLKNLATLMFTEDFNNRILAFDEKSAISFAEIVSSRRKNGQPISQADAQIASICYSNNAILATRNVKDFIDCQITVINPFE